jgi:hypothetical protein
MQQYHSAWYEDVKPIRLVCGMPSGIVCIHIPSPLQVLPLQNQNDVQDVWIRPLVLLHGTNRGLAENCFQGMCTTATTALSNLAHGRASCHRSPVMQRTCTRIWRACAKRRTPATSSSTQATIGRGGGGMANHTK